MRFFNFFTILLVIVIAGCQSIGSLAGVDIDVREPKLSFNSVDIAGIDFSGVNMIAHVNVENPNIFSIPMPKIDWELFINKASFVQGSLANDKSIASRGMATMAVPFSVSYDGLYNSFNSLLETKEAAYDVAMGITFPIPVLGDKIYTLDFSGVLPMIQKPDISFQGITKQSLGRTMQFVLNWEVDNKNNFAFDVGEFDYDFKVNNKQWAQGRLDDPPRLKANGKTLIPLSVSISAAPIVQELVDIINRGSSIAYNCTGNMSLSGELPGLDNLELPIDLKGNTRIR